MNVIDTVIIVILVACVMLAVRRVVRILIILAVILLLFYVSLPYLPLSSDIYDESLLFPYLREGAEYLWETINGFINK